MSRLFKNPPYAPLVTHQFPSTVWLPGSSDTLTVYPSALQYTGTETVMLYIDPCCRFLEHTTTLNLLDSTVTIEGMTPEGFQRLILYPSQEGWRVIAKKRRCIIRVKDDIRVYEKGVSFLLASSKVLLPRHEKARLILTSKNDSNWERLLREHRFLTLLEQVYLIDGESCDDYLFSNIKDLFLKGFSGVLVPRIENDSELLWGDRFWPKDTLFHSLVSLKKFVRSCFIKEDQQRLILLPRVPLKEILSGQVHNELLFDGALKCSFDWQKQHVRRVLLVPQQDLQCELLVHKASSCRLRVLGHKTTLRISLSLPQSFKKGKSYLLDNFAE